MRLSEDKHLSVLVSGHRTVQRQSAGQAREAVQLYGKAEMPPAAPGHQLPSSPDSHCDPAHTELVGMAFMQVGNNPRLPPFFFSSFFPPRTCRKGLETLLRTELCGVSLWVLLLFLFI